jgi:hypothetical protein
MGKAALLSREKNLIKLTCGEKNRGIIKKQMVF